MSAFPSWSLRPLREALPIQALVAALHGNLLVLAGGEINRRNSQSELDAPNAIHTSDSFRSISFRYLRELSYLL
jgi:hypothetical protein